MEGIGTLPTQVMAGGSNTDRDWERILTSIRDAEQGRTPSAEIVVRPGGAIESVVPGSGRSAGLSTVPTDVMAGGSNTDRDWERILTSIRDAEQGRTPSAEIVVRPGGAIESVVPGSGRSAGLSTVPTDVMAAKQEKS